MASVSIFYKANFVYVSIIIVLTDVLWREKIVYFSFAVLYAFFTVTSAQCPKKFSCTQLSISQTLISQSIL